MTPGSNSRTTNNFDLMRLAFASIVLLSHASELIYHGRSHEPLTQMFHTISFGDLGVDCFFILSGFMIASSWARDPRWWSFLAKRILRIYPGFIVAYLGSIVIVGSIGATSARGYLADLRPNLIIKELIELHSPTNPLTFIGSYYSEVNGSLWTIQYEFGCYIMVLMLGLAGLLASKRTTTVLWVVSLAAFVAFRAYHSGAELGAIAGSHKAGLIRFIPMYLSGLVIYKTEFWKKRHPLLIGLSITVLAIGMNFPLAAEFCVATAGAYLLFVIGFTPIRFLKAGRLPDISYGVYLYGWPVQKLLLLWWPLGSFLGIFALSFIGSVALGFASWFAVERPALTLKPRAWSAVGQNV